MIRVGTRGSDLARWQANRVLAGLGDSIEAGMVILQTSGDRDHSTALTQLVTPGFFTKEIEQALLDSRIDIAVHSLKDLPTQSPEGLELVAVMERGDPRDCLLVHPDALDLTREPLPVREGARLGSGANRRRAQVRRLRPDLQILDLRGNVNTRVRKLTEGQYDAILIAAAALARLSLDTGALHRRVLEIDEFVPAPGQAAVAVQMRADDPRKRAVRERLHHEPTARAVLAERALMRRLEGGCQLPLGAHACQAEQGWRLLASLAAPPRPGELPGPAGELLTLEGGDPDALGELAFEQLRGSARRRPTLAGCTVVVTRAADRAGELIAALESRGANVLLRPAIEIHLREPDDEERAVLARIAEFDWILLTSANAVFAFSTLLDGRWPAGVRLAAVGPSTAELLATQGRSADLVPERATGAALAEAFVAANPEPRRVLLPVGDQAREIVRRYLTDAGHEVTCLTVYENIAPERIAPIPAEIDSPYILFMSPSAVNHFIAAAEIPTDARLISIGPTTTAALEAAGLTVHREADPHTVEGLLEALL